MFIIRALVQGSYVRAIPGSYIATTAFIEDAMQFNSIDEAEQLLRALCARSEYSMSDFVIKPL